ISLSRRMDRCMGSRAPFRCGFPGSGAHGVAPYGPGQMPQAALDDLGMNEGLIRSLGVEGTPGNAHHRVTGGHRLVAGADPQLVGPETDEDAVLPVDGMVRDEAEAG